MNSPGDQGFNYHSLMFSCENLGVRTEDNTVIREKAHDVLFASNEYCKFIF